MSNSDAWVGGNTEVLGWGKRPGKAPFQVDPQRMADKATFTGQTGCFQALSSNGKFSLSLKDCETPQPFVCERGRLRFYHRI